MKTSKAFWAAFWEGVSAPGSLWSSPPKIRRIVVNCPARRSDRDAMRSDWTAIGGDFKRVITRQQTALLK